jgi:hypothetical protein
MQRQWTPKDTPEADDGGADPQEEASAPQRAPPPGMGKRVDRMV